MDDFFPGPVHGKFLLLHDSERLGKPLRWPGCEFAPAEESSRKFRAVVTTIPTYNPAHGVNPVFISFCGREDFKNLAAFLVFVLDCQFRTTVLHAMCVVLLTGQVKNVKRYDFPKLPDLQELAWSVPLRVERGIFSSLRHEKPTGTR